MNEDEISDDDFDDYRLLLTKARNGYSPTEKERAFMKSIGEKVSDRVVPIPDVQVLEER